MSSKSTNPKQVRLQDIADACGVSRNTVSKVLRGKGAFREETIERILDTAEALGYVPDPELSKWMTRLRERDKQQVLGEVAYVYFFAPDAAGDPPHWSAMKHAEVFLRRKGYRMSRFFYHPKNGTPPDEIARILLARGVEGVILGSMPSTQYEVDLPWDKLCGVALGRMLRSPILPMVDVDTYQAVRVCHQGLQQRGCERIGLCLPPGYDEQIRDSMRAAFLVEASLQNSSGSFPILEVNEDGGEQWIASFQQWRETHRLDGLIGFENLARRLQEEGVRIPEDLRFAAMHIGPTVKSVVPGVRDNWPLIGQTLAELLLSAIQHGQRGSRSATVLTLVEGAWEEVEDGLSARHSRKTM
jgi:LacI family transcriptional regulator